MNVLGIDPGVDTSHAVVVQLAHHHTPHPISAYGVRTHLVAHAAFGTNDTPGLLELVASWRRSFGLLCAGVEVARGSIKTGRDADGVLRAQLASGRLIGALESLGVPVLECPSGGDVAGWNWRHAIGAHGRGEGAKDAAIAAVLNVRLTAPLPRGKRGAWNTHLADAAGVAVATLDRAVARGIRADHDAYEVRVRLAAKSAIETHRAGSVRAGKHARMQARKLNSVKES